MHLSVKNVKIVFLSLKIDFSLANSADPDEMLCSVAFHLGLHYFPRNRPFVKSVYQKLNFLISHPNIIMLWVL